jgi:predicted RNA-binding protein YlqC (UPF0109 family)
VSDDATDADALDDAAPGAAAPEPGNVAGPGNRVEDGSGNHVDDDAGNRLDDNAGNRVEGGTARSVLDYIARSLATEPDAVVIDADDTGRQLRFRIHVAPDDMGRMIGRRGRVAQAIRTLVRVAGSRDGVDTNVDFVDS